MLFDLPNVTSSVRSSVKVDGVRRGMASSASSEGLSGESEMANCDRQAAMEGRELWRLNNGLSLHIKRWKAIVPDAENICDTDQRGTTIFPRLARRIQQG